MATLTDLISNNTSASPAFIDSLTYPPSGSSAGGSATSTGNEAAIYNVSKVDIHSLLYTGATTKVLAALMLWFGQSNHRSVGYSCNDPAQIHKIIQDMISRGFDGCVVAWYGYGNAIDTALQLVKAECELHPGFTFMIMMDQGAIQFFSPSGFTPQQTAVAFYQYAETTYFGSSACMKIGGRPVITNFAVNLNYAIDWNAVKAAMSNAHGIPIFWSGENTPSFNKPQSEGAYAWVPGASVDGGIAYLSDFYNVAVNVYPSKTSVGGAWKGFNDNLASWTSHRVMSQALAQTWLNSWARIGSYYSLVRQLPFILVSTWNDYEEGTEIETGIDNGVVVSASIAGNILSWSISGDESTVERYDIWLGADANNLNLVASTTARPPVHTTALSTILAAGYYQVYVQAVGRPSIRNQISGVVVYSIAGSGGGSGGGSGSGGGGGGTGIGGGGGSGAGGGHSHGESNILTPTYLVDPSGQQWLLRVDNNAVPQIVPVSGADAESFVYLNSVTDGISYKVSIKLV